MAKYALTGSVFLLSLIAIGYGIASIANIASLQHGGTKVLAHVETGYRSANVSFVDKSGVRHFFTTGYGVVDDPSMVIYDPADPMNAIVDTGEVWLLPLELLFVGIVVFLFTGFALFNASRKSRGEADAKFPEWYTETRINRLQYLALTLGYIIALLFIGATIFSTLGNTFPTQAVFVALGIPFIAGGFLLYHFRMNDVDPKVQEALWKKGSMWLFSAWLAYFAPSRSGKESSFHEVHHHLRLIGLNLAHWMIWLIAVFGLWTFTIGAIH